MQWCKCCASRWSARANPDQHELLRTAARLCSRASVGSSDAPTDIAKARTSCRAFCYSDGRPVHSRFESRRRQYKIERNMRLFYRMRYTHHRHMAVQDPATQTLSHALSQSNLAGADGSSGARMPSAADAIGAQPTDGDDLGLEDGTNGAAELMMPSIAEASEVRHSATAVLACSLHCERRRSAAA